VTVEAFEDPYQVPRVLRTILDAPVASGPTVTAGWVERVMKTPILELR
jgi:hypothetical protein